MTHTLYEPIDFAAQKNANCLLSIAAIQFYLESKAARLLIGQTSFCGESVGCLVALSQLLGSLTHCFLAVRGLSIGLQK